jgi:hypothetical protein
MSCRNCLLLLLPLLVLFLVLTCSVFASPIQMYSGADVNMALFAARRGTREGPSPGLLPRLGMPPG